MSSKLRISFLICTVLSLGFYFWQNQFASRGGNVALVKALWLGLTIFYWLVWPVLVFSSTSTALPVKRVYRIFWGWMLLRAVLELLLMNFNAWQYGYGIFHDLSCVLLLALGYRHIRQHFQASHFNVITFTLFIMMGMFVVETGFAYYIAQFNPPGEQAELWFIDWQSPHQANLVITTLVVIALTGWAIYLDWHLTVKRRLHEPTVY